MTFREDVTLDTSRVEDVRGRRIGGRGLAFGGGGLGGLVILVLAMLIGGGTGTAGLGSLLDQAVEAGTDTGPASTMLAAECKTGDPARCDTSGDL